MSDFSERAKPRDFDTLRRPEVAEEASAEADARPEASPETKPEATADAVPEAAPETEAPEVTAAAEVRPGGVTRKGRGVCRIGQGSMWFDVVLETKGAAYNASLSSQLIACRVAGQTGGYFRL